MESKTAAERKMVRRSACWIIVCFLSLSGQTVSLFIPECVCGERLARSGLSLKIAGGEEAGVNEFPWAALLVIKGKGRAKRCGGSLINDR